MKHDPKLALGWKERMNMTEAQKLEYRRIHSRLWRRIRRWKPKPGKEV